MSYGGDDDDDGQGFTRDQGLMLRLAGWIDLESRLTVGCVGAVLNYLQRKRAAEYLPGDRAAELAFRVTEIQMFSLDGTM